MTTTIHGTPDKEIMNNIIPGLSNNAYHHEKPYSDYLSSSSLKLYRVSPKAFRYALDNPTEKKTDSLRFGSLFHSLMECAARHHASTEAIDEWMRGFAVFEPPVNEKTGQPYGAATKAYKEAYDAFLQAAEDKTEASLTEVDTVLAMFDSLLYKCGSTSEQVAKLLKWGKEVETSYFYETEDGIKLKVRPDLLTSNKIVDWKTTSLDNLSEDSIARSIISYGYHISLSMYQYVLHEITGKWHTPILVFVQKTEPYDAVMVDLSEWCYQYDHADDFVNPGVGAMEFRHLLDLHTQCTKSGEWPGVENSIEADGNNRIMKPKIPYWLGMKYYNE